MANNIPRTNQADRAKYREKLNLLQNIRHVDVIQSRDEAFQRIKEITTFNEAITKKQRDTSIEKRKNLLLDLNKLKSHLSESVSLAETRNKLKTNEKDKLNQEVVDTIKKTHNTQDNISLVKRRYKLEQYHLYHQKRTVDLLWILLFVLAILILVSIFFSKISIILLSLGIFLLYGMYLIKVLLIDNVNMDKYNFGELDFSEPTEEELAADKKKSDPLFEFRAQDACDDDANNFESKTYQRYLDSLQEEKNVIGEIQNDIGIPADSDRCLETVRG